MPRKLPAARVDLGPHVQSLEDLGALVRDARAQSRLRIDDAAGFAGLSADTLSRLENGRPVTTDRLLKVLEVLGLAVLVVPRTDALRLQQTRAQRRE